MTIKARLTKDVSAFKNVCKGGKKAILNAYNAIKENPSMATGATLAACVVGGLALQLYGAATNNPEVVKTGAIIATTAIGLILPGSYAADALKEKFATSKSRAD